MDYKRKAIVYKFLFDDEEMQIVRHHQQNVRDIVKHATGSHATIKNKSLEVEFIDPNDVPGFARKLNDWLDNIKNRQTYEMKLPAWVPGSGICVHLCETIRNHGGQAYGYNFPHNPWLKLLCVPKDLDFFMRLIEKTLSDKKSDLFEKKLIETAAAFSPSEAT